MTLMIADSSHSPIHSLVEMMNASPTIVNHLLTTAVPTTSPQSYLDIPIKTRYSPGRDNHQQHHIPGHSLFKPALLPLIKKTIQEDFSPSQIIHSFPTTLSASRKQNRK